MVTMHVSCQLTYGPCHKLKKKSESNDYYAIIIKLILYYNRFYNFRRSLKYLIFNSNIPQNSFDRRGYSNLPITIFSFN